MTSYKPPCIVCGGEGCATSCAAPRFVVTTGGTYIGSVDFDAALRQLEIERDVARVELGERMADYQDVSQRLDDALAEVERLHARIEHIAASHVESLRLSVEAARREGAEAMREAAARMFDEESRQWGGRLEGVMAEYRAEAIRALPLPGEEEKP